MRLLLLVSLFLTSCNQLSNNSSLPTSYDLRNVSGTSYVSAVKNQSGGTCWTHGTMASLEGNLLKTGIWTSGGETGEPNLAEYHLDWWNGFNSYRNDDIAPRTAGLVVHEGGDYLLATAYTSRGGAVRDVDGQSFNSAPALFKDTYHYFYPRDVVWLSSVEEIKQAITDYGVIGTSLTWSNSYYSSSKNTFYQPPTSTEDPNHAVSMVGWDDNKVTQAPQKGAWLIKNSWGSSWGDNGYFWISYYDKIAGHHATMGAISFQNVEKFKYKKTYYLDYHGWRDTLTESNTALNVLKTTEAGSVSAIGFYTAADSVDYSIEVYSGFVNGQPSGLLSNQWGHQKHKGYHTVDIPEVSLAANTSFAVLVTVSNGGQPFDKTSDVPVLLCGSQHFTIVESVAKAGESYYLKDGSWVDLQMKDRTANFTIRAFTK